MKYDIKQARLAYNNNTGCYGAANFAQYSPAYVNTNEDIREIIYMLNPGVGAHVLTVAGSGDQALHYKLAGASHIDTFDITFNAKMMMDIKTTAIQHLECADYDCMVRRIAMSNNILAAPMYQQIEKFMPADTRNHVRDMHGARLVRTGSYGEMLFKDEFAKLKKSITGPFNFIWTDLSDLSSHLTQTYDQIYLSNILQYNTDTKVVTPLIMDLARFLKPGGIMVVNVTAYFIPDDLEVVAHLKQHVAQSNIGVVKCMHNHLFDMCILQKR